MLLESSSGRLGIIESIIDNLRGAICFASIELASSFTQLKVAEKGNHKKVFRDAHGEL